MSVLHRQLPQFAFAGVKKTPGSKSKPEPRPAAGSNPPQQQAQRSDSEPVAVPGYN